MSIEQPSDVDATGLYLLFARGKRPDRAAIKEFVSEQRGVTLSHDPADGPSLHLATEDGETLQGCTTTENPADDLVWLELLRNGLTFDLCGLEPGGASRFPQVEHRFDLERLPGAAHYDAVHLAPGHHLTGGERTLPVVKAMIALARDLVHHFDALEAVVWPASQSAIGRRFFESVTTAWLDGGPFPALGLTAFRETIDGAIQSTGLDFWIGQELRIEQPLSSDKVSATRLGVRLVNQLIAVGGIEGDERIVAPDGSRLLLRTSRNGRFIRVSRE